MKHLLFAALCLILFSQSLSAQSNFYNWTLYGSISSPQAPVIPDLFVNQIAPLNEFRFNLERVKPEMAIGVRRNFRFSDAFFGSLGVAYSQKEETYSLNFTHPNIGERTDYNELLTTRKIITLPIGIGVRMGLLDVMSGIKAQYTMSSAMEGETTMGIEMAKPHTDFGWYSGVGLNIDRVRIGVNYQSMLSRDGHYVIHDGAPLELISVSHGFSFNVGMSF